MGVYAIKLNSICSKNGDINMNKYIQSDLFRYRCNTSFKSFISEYSKNAAFRYMVAHRLINSKGIERVVGKILLKLNRNQNIKIPKDVKIGYGLYIGHNGPIVINRTTVIGNNCNLAQFTTIGSNDGCAAEIGDNVYIGPNVCLVEHVKIGNNVTIGAGSVVTKDIPDNATAAGNYAKVLNYNNPGRYVNNRWKI